MAGSSLATIPAPIKQHLDQTMTEVVVRQAIDSVYAGAPIQEIALAVALVKTHFPENPVGALLAGHVAVFKPASSDRWTWMWSLDAWLNKAHEHPNFGGLTFKGPFREGDEIRYECDAWGKTGERPLAGGVVGRCKFEGQRSARSGGGKYTIEWAEEIARARAIRHACRIAYGITLAEAPGEQFAEVIAGKVIDVEAEAPKEVEAKTHPTPSEVVPDEQKSPSTRPASDASSEGAGQPETDVSSGPGNSGAAPPPEQEETPEREEAPTSPEPPPPPASDPSSDQGKAERDTELVISIEAAADEVFQGADSRRRWFATKFKELGAEVLGDLDTSQREVLLAELEGLAKKRKGA